MRRYVTPLAAIGFALFVFTGFLTWGSGRLQDNDILPEVYDAQAESLAHGRFDIPPDVIMWEAFERDGRAYTYFGPTPALPRILLNGVFAGMRGRWARISLLVSCALNLAFAWLFVRFIQERFYPAAVWKNLSGLAVAAFLIACGLGSTNVFLASRQYVYHEAVAWGATLALMSYYFLLRYLSGSLRVTLLVLAGVCSYFSFFARMTPGSGTLVALLIVLAGILHGDIQPSGGGRKHGAILAGFLLLAAASYMLVNYQKFGSPWDPQPLRFHVSYPAARLARIGETLFHPENSWFNFVQYFIRPNLRLEPPFPWVYLQAPRRVDTSNVKLDLLEPFASLPASAPALVALALIGLVGAVRSVRRGIFPLTVVALASLAGGAAALPVAAISERYLHDFYPFLLVAGAAGLCEVSNWSVPVRRWALQAALPTLAAASVFMNLAFVFDIEANFVARLRRWRARVDRAVSLSPLEPIQTDLDHLPRHAVHGNLLVLGKHESVYWYDVEKWVYVTGREVGRFRLRVRFPGRLGPGREPVLVAGRRGACDILYVETDAPGVISFGFEHENEKRSKDQLLQPSEGLPVDPQLTEHVAIDPGRDTTLDATVDPLNALVTVTLDGKRVLWTRTGLRRWRDEEVAIGANLIGCDATDKFSGTISRIP